MIKNVVGCLVVSQLLQVGAAVLDLNLQGQAGAGLLPENEVPTPNSTGASATANGPIQYNPANNQLTFDISFTLSGAVLGGNDAPVGAWIRGPASTMQTAPILYFLDNYLTTSGVNSGSLQSPSPSGTFTLQPNPNGSSFSIQDQETQLSSGLWYIELASAGTYSMGEIRGNLVPVPEPSAYLALTGIALGGFAFARRMKRAT